MEKSVEKTAPAVPNADWREGLECTVGRARLVVPSEMVDSIIELELSPPPPLGRKWVGGLGYHEQRAVVCVCLVPPSAGQRAQPRRLVKGILCRVKDSEVGWLLEVVSVKSFLKVRSLPPKAPEQPSDQLPSWIGAAATADGRPVGWIDVEAMVRELAGTA